MILRKLTFSIIQKTTNHRNVFGSAAEHDIFATCSNVRNRLRKVSHKVIPEKNPINYTSLGPITFAITQSFHLSDMFAGGLMINTSFSFGTCFIICIVSLKGSFTQFFSLSF